MTFCRRGNDYADVAQPFRLTGGSHGGGADVAWETGDRHVPSPPYPTLPLLLSLAFSRVMEEPPFLTCFRVTELSEQSDQIKKILI